MRQRLAPHSAGHLKALSRHGYHTGTKPGRNSQLRNDTAKWGPNLKNTEMAMRKCGVLHLLLKPSKKTKNRHTTQHTNRPSVGKRWIRKGVGVQLSNNVYGA